MVNRQVSKRLWDHILVYEAQIISITTGKGGRTPLEKLKWDTPDTLVWVDFEFYDIVWNWDKIEIERKLGRWLGVYHCFGGILFCWILKSKCDIISITIV